MKSNRINRRTMDSLAPRGAIYVLIFMTNLAVGWVQAEGINSAQASRPDSVTAPAISLAVKDASNLRQFFLKNAWLKDFQNSNLRSGLLVRLGAVLNAVPVAEQEGTWKGKLSDFFVGQILKDKPLFANYYYHQGLASPFVVVFPKIPETEKILSEHILAYFTQSENEVIDFSMLSDKAPPTQVNAARVGVYRFAYKFFGNCLVMSRDPKLVALEGSRCPQAREISSGFEVQVDAPSLIPTLANFFRNYLQTDGKFLVSGEFKDSVVSIDSVQVNWKNNQRVTEATDFSEFLASIPSRSVFASFLPVTFPLDFSTAGLLNFFKNKDRGTTSTAKMALFFVLDQRQFSSALLIRDSTGSKKVAQWRRLYPGEGIKMKMVCGNKFLFISKSLQPDLVEQTCMGQQPGLDKISLGKAMQTPLNHGVLVNLAVIGKNWLESGWVNDSGPGAMPPELAQTLNLLGRLSVFFGEGHFTKDSMSYKVTRGDW